ncbi:hypothetical protein OH76DRAFT_1251985 [Lentinus brumalis]|uniref:Secreted protein n=1 Tax=Lentinus brumalis TaxID=2498619 RepID=A0A371CRS5_9APHY|nr:hypothetical protein OH76DRAFT_1251985 [Polyporus brumalis]
MHALLLCSLLSLPSVSSLHGAVEVVTAAASHCDIRNRSPARLIEVNLSRTSRRLVSLVVWAASHFLILYRRRAQFPELTLTLIDLLHVQSTSTHSCAARSHRSSSEHSLYPHLSTEPPTLPLILVLTGGSTRSSRFHVRATYVEIWKDRANDVVALHRNCAVFKILGSERGLFLHARGRSAAVSDAGDGNTAASVQSRAALEGV